ncbi:MAG: hypothetical protein ACR2JG_04950 [Geodermatophilaceae bacterium]
MSLPCGSVVGQLHQLVDEMHHLAVGEVRELTADGELYPGAARRVGCPGPIERPHVGPLGDLLPGAEKCAHRPVENQIEDRRLRGIRQDLEARDVAEPGGQLLSRSEVPSHLLHLDLKPGECLALVLQLESHDRLMADLGFLVR